LRGVVVNKRFVLLFFDFYLCMFQSVFLSLVGSQILSHCCRLSQRCKDCVYEDMGRSGLKSTDNPLKETFGGVVYCKNVWSMPARIDYVKPMMAAKPDEYWYIGFYEDFLIRKKKIPCCIRFYVKFIYFLIFGSQYYFVFSRRSVLEFSRSKLHRREVIVIKVIVLPVCVIALNCDEFWNERFMRLSYDFVLYNKTIQITLIKHTLQREDAIEGDDIDMRYCWLF